MNNPKDNLSNKVCMVTGATSGIGQVAARTLAGMGTELYLVCRNRVKGERTAADILARTGNDRVTLLLGDLSSLADVRHVAQSFLERDKPLHLLLNNAGVFNFKREITIDGYEEMFAVNHLAHFLLTNLLLDRIKASAPARIVNVASGAHMLVKGINFADLNFNADFRALKVYSHSKLANVLFNMELAKRTDASGVTANAVHPGTVATGLGLQNGWLGKLLQLIMKPFLQSSEKGAKTSIYACVSSDLDGVTGRYFEDCREEQPRSWATDDAAAQRLWEVSAKLTDLPASLVA
jgi:NAD(P)-dependent dehydrogenase (short-subunit alcohol dehydrogenase family)